MAISPGLMQHRFAGEELFFRDHTTMRAVDTGQSRDNAAIREESAAALAKIKFSLDDIRPDGLRGPDDGLVSVAEIAECHFE